ncbi:hypothetical protein P9217_15765 [Mesorhizobium sp. WSM4989]|nr:hypothetical protein [Mesorhizobium sp. AA23]MDG4919460.1 hypothetical protein [Mesorhizobium sp. WSM4989]
MVPTVAWPEGQEPEFDSFTAGLTLMRTRTLPHVLGRIDDRAFGRHHAVEEGAELRQRLLAEFRSHDIGEAPDVLFGVGDSTLFHFGSSRHLQGQHLAELCLDLGRIIGRRRRQDHRQVDVLVGDKGLGVLGADCRGGDKKQHHGCKRRKSFHGHDPWRWGNAGSRCAMTAM